MVKLTAADGHELDAYVAEPKGNAKGGVVVVQEIFGVTDHVKRVADQYAAEGFQAIAPAMFDRIKPRITLAYSDIQQGIAYMRQLEWPNTLVDVEAAAEHVRDAGGTAVVGFCWGGTVAHVAASELDFDAAVSYYGGGVTKLLDREPQCAIIYHIGDQDHSIPMADIDRSRSPIRRPRYTSTKARSTASIATSAAPTARRTRRSRSAGRSTSSVKKSHEAASQRVLLRLKNALVTTVCRLSRGGVGVAMR